MPANNDRKQVFLSLQKLTKHYSEGDQVRIVLNDVTVEICRGEIASILGKSGSGKTTLLNLICGIDLPDSGVIQIDGSDLTKMDDHQRTLFRRKKVGFIFQFFNLIPTLTVWENVTLPLELNNQLNHAGKSRAIELLESVGLSDRSTTYPDRFE